MNAATSTLAPYHPPRVSTSTLLFVAALHLAAVWALSSLGVAQQLVREVTPLMVSLVRADAPPAPPAPPMALPRAAAPAAPTAPQITPPTIVVDTPVRSAEPSVVVSATPAPVSPAEAARAPVVAEPMVPPAPPAPSAPPTPRQLPASAVRYLVQPAIDVPMASRRLGEAGTVLLRVVVDVRGLPRQVTLHRSSGFSRLDEQALAAMRAARFQPQTENGTPVEWIVIAPLQYEID